MYLITISIILSIIAQVSPIRIISCKIDLEILNNTWYQYNIKMLRSNAQLISSDISLSYFINNSIPTVSQYFDYFPYLSSTDEKCYLEAIGNQSYLYPCTFLLSKFIIDADENSKIRVSSVNNQKQFSSIPIEIINDMHYYFLIDNTPFPFPEGAFPYSDISITLCNQIDVKLSDSYESLGVRLIYINVTVFFIYFVVILIIFCKNRQLNKQIKEGDQGIHDVLINVNNDDQSERDNYEEIVNNEFSIETRTNKEKISSIISSQNGKSAYKMQ